MLRIDYKKKFTEKDLEISFQTEGGITVFFGRSGAGKTLTLRSIAGLMTPDWGVIKVGDETYFDSDRKINLSPQQRRTGYVFQSYALFPHLTVEENLELAAASAGIEGKAIDSLLEEIGIEDLRHRYPEKLSGGEQQRVALARAVARDPHILLLDEPFSAVDAPSRDRLRSLLRKVQRQRQIPAILVTHQAYEAYGMGDIIVVMDQGRVEQVGTPEEVFYRPQTVTTARLVGAKNIFQGEIAEVREGVFLLRQGERVWEATRSGTSPLSPGDPVSWCIRPESVMLLREDRPGFNQRENRLKALISEVEVKGPIWDLFLTSEDGLELKVELPAHAAQQMGVAEGKMVVASLKRESIHIIRGVAGSKESDLVKAV